MDVCVLCDGELLSGEAVTILTAKGCAGIRRSSESRGEHVQTSVGQKEHTKWRQVFCNPMSIQLSGKRRDHDGDTEESGPGTRSSTGSSFSYNEQCIFCGTGDKYKGEKPACGLIPVRTVVFQTRIQETCARRNDAWSESVMARIEYVQDLFAAHAVYHHRCSTNFRTGRSIPVQFSQDMNVAIKRLKQGRSNDTAKTDAFFMVVDYLTTHDDEQTTIGFLIDKMREYLPSDVEPYGFTYMKSCIKKQFGEDIIITEINGKSNVVTFRHTAASIISDFYQQPKETDPESEKNRTIEAASKLIKSDIKSVTQPMDAYPTCSQLSSTDETLWYLPSSLRIFLESLFVGMDTTKKISSIGQAIMQAVRRVC